MIRGAGAKVYVGVLLLNRYDVDALLAFGIKLHKIPVPFDTGISFMNIVVETR